MRRKGGLGMSEWKKVKLGEVCDTQYGFTASTVQQDTGTQFLRITDIVPQLIDWNTVPYCQIQEKDREKYLLHKGDIVVARTGATVGYAKYIKEDVPAVFASYLVRLLVNSIDVDRHYVGLCVESNHFKEYIQSISNGSAQPNANAQMISSFEINLPPLSTQHRIATILSRYDSLIENYQKQIKLLEEAAQRLYKEWFVDLRFPGHENTNIVDGVPEGWDKKKVGEVIAKVPRSKQIPTKDYQNEGAIPIIDQSRDYIAGYTDDIESRVESNEPYIVFGDHTRILKYVPFAFAKGADGTQLIMSNNLDLMPQCLLFTSLVNVDLSNYSYARHFKYLKEEIIIVPTSLIANLFSKHVAKWYVKIQQNREQLRLLTEARDRLLPKLMSGDIEI